MFHASGTGHRLIPVIRGGCRRAGAAMTPQDERLDLFHSPAPTDAFCGRPRELAALQQDFVDVCAGTPRLVLLEGPGGIGISSRIGLVRRLGPRVTSPSVG
ncbi:hypothetical protein [Streptomyces sp. NPDC017941]|uniref:hypothetical protein n=1 Tax=Streptomyces sp. NPDC017941 TaxID=3365018 RepID=UPI00379557DE